jgi:hypothetical protein
MKPALTITPLDGSIQIVGIALALRKGSTYANTMSALGSLFRASNDFGTGYEWLSFHQVSLGGQPCDFTLGFHLGKMEDAHFSVTLPGATTEDGWPTRQAIDEELAFMKKVLSAQLGVKLGKRDARFPWGRVWSTFDPKGFQASTGLRYEV